MSKTILAGRIAAQSDEPIVVFLLGARINKIRAFKQWLPVIKASGTMMQTLYKYPEKGFLGGEDFYRWREVVMIQYWKSYEDLERFARNPSEPHLKPWQAFHKMANSEGVGIWHETYEIPAHGFEAIYANMPLLGLAKVTNHIPAVGSMSSSRRRMQKASESTIDIPAELKY